MGRARWRNKPPRRARGRRVGTTRRPPCQEHEAPRLVPGPHDGPEEDHGQQAPTQGSGHAVALGPDHEQSHDHRGHDQATARHASTSARGCASHLRGRGRRGRSPGPTAVAGSSHELTFPGSDRFQSQFQPSPDTSETTAITARPMTTDPTTVPTAPARRGPGRGPVPSDEDDAEEARHLDQGAQRAHDDAEHGVAASSQGHARHEQSHHEGVVVHGADERQQHQGIERGQREGGNRVATEATRPRKGPTSP